MAGNIGIGIANAIGFNKIKKGGTSSLKPITSYRAYDKTNDDEDRAVLKDLTGNGHDIQLYNFAFAESSGYGKYPFSFTIDLNAADYITKVGYQKYCINGNPPSWLLYRHYNEKVNFRIKISNLKDASLIIKIGENRTIISEDGIYSFNKETEALEYILVAHNSSYNFDNLVVELLPDYQGALVSDGVDDYGLCENFPVFTPEKGFTICAIREYISDKIGCLVTNHISGTISNFMFEATNAEYKSTCLSFNKQTSITIEKQKFSYMTSNKYNDNTIAKGNDVATIDKIRLFSYYAHNNNFVYNAALYALEIYDRDLTDEEIATVKARMIAEYEEKTGNKYEEETV